MAFCARGPFQADHRRLRLGIQTGVMSDRGKMNLEELRKSFPSLDDFSAKKLLGGWDEEPAPDDGPSDNTGSNPGAGSPGGPPSTGSPSGGAVTAGGGDYFGDRDWGNDSWGDGGWGDGGWGDTGPGGDSNPGSSEGGNGQNSSGNPGNEQGGTLEWQNSTTAQVHPHRTYNTSGTTMYCKPEDGGGRFEVPNGGFTDQEIDVFKINGQVYKVVDEYGTIIVTGQHYFTNYTSLWQIAQQQAWNGIWGNPCERSDFDENDTQWDEIFQDP